MRRLLRYLGDETAVVAATTAILAPALILFLALGVEVGEWYAMERQAQTVADAAAIAAALELANGGSLTTARTEAGWAAKVNGFSGTPTINQPPSQGAYAGSPCLATTCTGYVEAMVSRSQGTLFANLFISSVTIGARAVASWSQPYQSCGLALASAGTAISIAAGAPTLTFGNPTLGTGCVLASNSTDADSMDLGAASSVTAQTLISAGGINGTCTGCATGVVVDGPVTPDLFSCSLAASATFCGALALPGGCSAFTYASPVAGSCYSDMTIGASFTGSISSTTLTVTAVAEGSLQVGETVAGTGIAGGTSITALGTGTGGAGTYTVSAAQTIGSESMAAQATVTLPSGTYYTQGNFDVTNGSTVSGSGVTIVLTNSGACEGNIVFESGSTATLTGPSAAGSLSGMVFAQVAPSGFACSSSDSVAATASATLSGRIYSPDATWAFNAAPTTTCLAGGACASNCLTVTANVLQFGGNIDLESVGCTAPSGVDAFNVQSVSLVE